MDSELLPEGAAWQTKPEAGGARESNLAKRTKGSRRRRGGVGVVAEAVVNRSSCSSSGSGRGSSCGTTSTAAAATTKQGNRLRPGEIREIRSAMLEAQETTTTTTATATALAERGPRLADIVEHADHRDYNDDFFCACLCYCDSTVAAVISYNLFKGCARCGQREFVHRAV